MTDLTPMQAASWSGRQSGGVAAHLYAELDGAGLDAGRLASAVARLYRRHPMLRMRVTPAGRQMVLPFDPHRHALRVDDLTGGDPDTELAATRQRMTHQTLDLADGRACEFTLSQLPGGRHRLHIDLDMIAADPSCFGRLMEDLARFYADPQADFSPLQPCYLDLIPPPRQDPADRAWWRETLADLPDALRLPAPVKSAGKAQSTSLSARLDPAVRRALQDAARAGGVTPAMLALAVFAQVMAAQTGMDHFRLTVPDFLRPSGHPHGDALVGDFADISVLAVRDARTCSSVDLAADLSAQLAAALSHRGWPMIAALRDMSRDRGRLEGSPVVFTAGFGLPGGSILSDAARHLLGDLGWAVSQGPGVALDVQLAEQGAGLLLNWDLRLDLVDEHWAKAAFARYLSALRALASADAQPLGALARAYLLGRGDALPLGGVAMQEFREYRGAMSTDDIAARLRRVVAVHPALRRHIDADRALSCAQADAPLPLEIVDLRHKDARAAEADITAARADFAHCVDDLSGCPWALRLYHLPQSSPDRVVAFLRVDALILDGFGIARIARQIFGRGDITAPPAPVTDPPAATRAEAETWWRSHLSGLSAPPDLPWIRPPDRIARSRYARRHVTVPRGDLAALRRIGAAAGLMPGNTLSTLVLDTLARWTPKLSLCVALPVAGPPGGDLGNSAGFIALAHDARADTLPDRAARLQRRVLGGLTHRAFSGVDLTRLLLSRQGARIALPVVLTNGLGWDRPEADAPMRWSDGLTQTPQVALDIRLLLDAAGNLVVAADHAVEALDGDMVQAMLDAMAQALGAVAAMDALPDTLPHDRPVCAPDPARPIPYLAQIAARLDDPKAGPALIQSGQPLSYRELGADIRALMAGLRARGLRRGAVLAICLPRGADHLALQLAAAFEGLIWVPVDASSPPERLSYLLRACGADLVIGRRDVTPGLPDRALSPDDLRDDPAQVSFDPDALAAQSDDEGAGYYLFTSGTTGQPKCVALSNRATANTLGATLARWRIGPGDVVMSVTPLHHDMSVFDLFGTLAAGATLVMPDPGADKDAAHWADLVAAHRMTVWVSVPAIVDMLMVSGTDRQLASLRLIAQGGDYIRPTAIRALQRRLPAAALWSLGGPTETVIWSIWHEITPADETVIPYGRALPGNSCHVLDDLGRPCPPGVIGRLHSSGVNLALGYVQDGALLQTDFTMLDTGTGQQRAFRSGDLGWRRADGAIIFAGRIDGYVKLRGVRVSLPDIAAHLATHPQISAALVVDLPDPVSGETMLAAVYLATDDPGAAALRAFLRDRLPVSHLPSRLMRIDAFPLSANGKPDRAAIRALMGTEASPGAGLPDQIAGLCAQVLDLPKAQIGADSPLLMLGLLPRHLPVIAAGLARLTGRDVPPHALLSCRSPAEMAGVAT